MNQQIVFIVGMPRSGTKLLRDLLNRHADVAIFPHETHFFPVLQKRLPSYGNITSRENFARLYADLQKTAFFRRMTARGISLDAEAWFHSLQGGDFRALLDGLFTCYRKLTGSRIVGDKTPSYITHVSLLGQALPHAKFVHILRDPRDYALSMRSAWGKDIVRAVARWKQGVRKCRRDASDSGVAYTEIRYEELLGDPRQTLARLCQFLDIGFTEDMLTLAQPAEMLGDARGASTIVRDNLDKWRQQLSEPELQSIESVAGKLMMELGYVPVFTPGDRNLTRLEDYAARAADAINLFRFTVREQGGVIKGLEHLWYVARYRPPDEA
jgi:hypothetical protein